MSELHKTYQYRLHLTRGQSRILEQQLEECRWVYNQTLATRKQVTRIRARRSPFTIRSTSFLIGKPNKERSNWYTAPTYPQYGNGARLDSQRVILSKVGAVAMNLHRPVAGTIKTVTLKRTSTGKWYISFATEQAAPPRTTVPAAAVGIDVGLEKFATLSTGELIPNPRFFRCDERDMKRAQRKLSKEAKGTLQRAKRRKVVARIHERIANRRKNFAHQVSRKLVDQFGTIVFEDVSIARMLKNHQLAKSIADAAWNQLL